MKVYLSGPMTGLPDFNRPAFHAATRVLRGAGLIVYNPAEFENFEPRRAFAAYSAFICLEADVVVLLPGWQSSLGVSAELALAKNCKIGVFEYGHFILDLPTL